MGRYALRLPESTKKAASIETAEDFFRRRAARATGRGRELLDRAGTELPKSGDELQ